MKRLIPVLVLACIAVAAAEEMERLDLLNRRLSVAMPKGSRSEARGHGIMAAPEAGESEARLVFEDGERKLVVMAWELFRRAGDNYREEVSKALKEWAGSESTTFEVTTVGERITMGVPAEPDAGDDAILHAAAFVRHRDDSVLRAAVYFNPEFHTEPARCAALAKQIIGSIETGDRSLMLGAGERELGILNDPSRLVVTVPEGWTFATQRGVDFVVHSLQQVSEFGAPAASIGIYVGGHPGYHHERIEPGALTRRTRKAALFGEPREWVEYSTKDDADWKNIEIISDIPGIDGYWKTHIFTGAADDKRLAGLLDIAATARIRKRAEDSGRPPARPEPE